MDEELEVTQEVFEAGTRGPSGSSLYNDHILTLDYCTTMYDMFTSIRTAKKGQ